MYSGSSQRIGYEPREGGTYSFIENPILVSFLGIELVPHPLEPRAISGLPPSGSTINILARIPVFFPMPLRNLAKVREEILWVTVKVLKALGTLAWTTRSGILSRTK